MSRTEEAAVDEDVCANCGIAEVDNITLEECDACKLVRYCSDKCREDHREQHEEECKKWKAELFTQPDETHHGDCPICFLPMPVDQKKSIFWSCCSKSICQGCDYANFLSTGRNECSFCREPLDEEEYDKRVMKRVKANDPDAICQMGGTCYKEGDYEGALEYWTKAAELGNADAHAKLGTIYDMGTGVEQDAEKAVYHWEKAAMGGHPHARHALAIFEEENNGNIERAVKHLIIAANLGLEQPMKALREHYSAGNISKEDLEATLRSHHAAVDAMKSAQRDAAEAYVRKTS